MEFPRRLPLRIAFAFGADPASDPAGWSWVEVTDDLPDQIVQIIRGRQDESSHVTPSQAMFVLDNPHGHYTPDQALSPYYPHVDLGVPVRMWVDMPGVRAGLATHDTPDSFADTPPHATLDITGDLGLTADITPASWRPAEHMVIAARYRILDPERAWFFGLRSDGRLSLIWSTDGTAAGRVFVDSTAAIPADAARLVVDARLDVDADGQHVITFLTGPAPGALAPLGAPVVLAGTTQVAPASATHVTLGSTWAGAPGITGWQTFDGTMHSFQIHDGVDAGRTNDLSGPLGAQVTAANSGGGDNTPFDDAAGFGDVTYTAAGALCTVAAQATAARGWLTSPAEPWGRLYLRPNANPAVPMQFARFATATDQIRLMLRILASGVPAITDATFTNRATGSALTLDTWHRIEWHASTGTGADLVEMRIYSGANVHGTTPDQTLSASSMTVETWDRVRLGISFSSAQTYTLDIADPGLSDVGWLGPTPVLVAAPVFDDQLPETTQFTDEVGRPWEIKANAEIVDDRVRLIGLVSDLRPTWPYGDLSDTADPMNRPGESRVHVVVSGILRQMEAGASTPQSSLYRDLSTRAEVVAYWPCEDGEDSQQFASALGHAPAQTTGDVNPASYSDLPASKPLPTLNAGILTAAIPAYTGEADQRFVAYLAAPADGVATNQRIFQLSTTGSAASWEIVLEPAGLLFLRIRDADGDTISTSTSFSMGQINGGRVLLSLWLQQSGGTINWQVSTFHVGDPFGLIFDGTVAGHTFGRFRRVQSGVGGDLSGTAFGHYGVINGNVHSIWDVVFRSLVAWTGEPAAERMQRLCGDEGIPLRILGDAAQSARVGPQRPKTLVELLREAADADGGLLYETRYRLGFTYRTLADLYNQDAALDLDGTRQWGDLVNPFAPVRDDQAARNDITVTRVGGSSFRAIDDADIAKRGRYDTDLTRLLHADEQLPHVAGWALHLGTWPGMRYPEVSPALNAQPDLIAAWARLDLGDKIVVRNLPPQHPSDNVELLAQGYTEDLAPNEWQPEVNATPGGPWNVGVLDDNVLGRADTDGSRLALPIDAEQTDILVETTRGPTWVEDPAELPLDVRIERGEIARVTTVEMVRDEFDRTEADGWGVATSGQAWTVVEGAAANFSVSAGHAHIAVDDPVNRIRWGVSTRDIDLSGTVSLSQLATGAWILAQPAVRELDASNYYTLAVEFKDTGNVGHALIRVVDGVGTGLVGAEIGSYSAGEVFRWRFAIRGSRLLGKLWRDADPEPSTWTLKVTDTVLPDAGSIKVRQQRNPGNTNSGAVVSYGDLLLRNAQVFTVERAVNGVARGWPAGADVRLANPMIAPN